MKRNFCGPCPGPFSVFHCIMFARPIQENPWEVRDSILGRVSEEYPIWNDFLTFSTGFSTDFVKKKWVFPQCFPLFPPSFPQKIELWVIHDVFQNGKRGKIWREKGSKSLFLKRKSRPKFIFCGVSRLGQKRLSPLEFLAQEFSTNAARQKPCVENRGKTRVFHKLRREKRKAPPGPDGPQRRWNAGKIIRPRRCRGRRLRR